VDAAAKAVAFQSQPTRVQMPRAVILLILVVLVLLGLLFFFSHHASEQPTRTMEAEVNQPANAQ
jgi:hypothetical protein